MPTQEEIAETDFLSQTRGTPSYQPAWDAAFQAGIEGSPFQGATLQELEMEKAEVVDALRGRGNRAQAAFGGQVSRKEVLKEYTEQLAEVEAAIELFKRQKIDRPQVETLGGEEGPLRVEPLETDRRPMTDQERQEVLNEEMQERLSRLNEIEAEQRAQTMPRRKDAMPARTTGSAAEAPTRRAPADFDTAMEHGQVEAPAAPGSEEVVPGEGMSRKKTAYEITDEAVTAGELPEDEHLHLLMGPKKAGVDQKRAKKIAETRRKIREARQSAEGITNMPEGPTK